MKKIYPILLILTIFLLFPIITYADCTTEELNNFKKIEEEYKIVSTISKETGTYTIKLYNPEPQNYTYQINNEYLKTLCTIKKDSDSECNNVLPGSYNVSVIGNTETCPSTLKRISIKLSPYNPYSEDPLCDGIEEFVLCQETYDKEINYSTFISRVNTYKNTKKNETSENKKENNVALNKILEYIKNNIFQIIVIVAFLITLTITIILTVKSSKKSRRLE